jgi:hypothetical protein
MRFRMKKIILIGTMALSLSACSSLHDKRYGDAPGDPCIRCGENWVFIQNEPFGALKNHEWSEDKISHY